MGVSNGFIEAIGNTPLIRLQVVSEETGCDILGKAEFLNPGGSVKDRAAWWMIREAEQSGHLQAGGAVEVARKLGPGHSIVTMLCDGGNKYQSSLYDREWLLEKGSQVVTGPVAYLHSCDKVTDPDSVLMAFRLLKR